MEFQIKTGRDIVTVTDKDIIKTNGKAWWFATKRKTFWDGHWTREKNMPLPKTKCLKWIKDGALIEIEPNTYQFSRPVEDETTKNNEHDLFAYELHIDHNGVAKFSSDVYKCKTTEKTVTFDYGRLSKSELGKVINNKVNTYTRTLYSLQEVSDAKEFLKSAYKEEIELKIHDLETKLEAINNC